MNLSALMKGYKRMCEFVNELDITSCDNPGDLKMYKNIKCALTFVSSDVFGCLCQDNQDKMCKKHFIVDEILDETYHNIHNIAEITAYMITNKSNGAWHWESSNDVYMDIHHIYTNGVVLEDKQDLMNGDNIRHMHSDKYIKYIGAFIIYKTMEATAEEILSQVSHKKIQINVQLSSIYKLGEFSSAEEAKKEYGDCEISVEMLKDKERLSSQIEFTEEKTDEYMTRAEIEAEWKENDEVDIHQEFEDNIKLGIFKANFSEKMYEKILNMNNYQVIKNDNGGRIVCHPLT